MNKLTAIIAALSIASSLQGETLHDKVKDYLTEDGLPKPEYFQSHGILLSTQGNTGYRQYYLLDNQPFMADYFNHTPIQIDSNLFIGMLDKGADVYFYDNRWYTDVARDGINGNESLLNPTNYEVKER